MRHATIILIGAVMAGGCVSHSAWERQTFAFSTPAAPASQSAPTNIVSLARVSVSPVFRSKSFTYWTADDTYEQDPYAGFLVSPERALAGPIRAWMREGGSFGCVAERGSHLRPSVAAEVSVTELCGDFRKPSRPMGAMTLHFVVYELQEETPGRVLLDKVCARATPLSRNTPAALMAAWDDDLRQIMEEVNADYAKASSHDSR